METDMDMIPSSLRALEVLRNRAGSLVQAVLCNGYEHFTVYPSLQLLAKPCDGIGCKAVEEDFPADFVGVINREQQSRLKIGMFVPGGKVLYFTTEDKRMHFKNGGEWATQISFTTGTFLEQGEYVIGKTDEGSHYLHVNSNGKMDEHYLGLLKKPKQIDRERAKVEKNAWKESTFSKLSLYPEPRPASASIDHDFTPPPDTATRGGMEK